MRLYPLAFNLYTLASTPQRSLSKGSGQARGSSSFFRRRNAFRVAILAFDEMNVVRAFCGTEGSVHGFHIEAAIRQLRMTIRARGTSLLAVLLVAGKATQPFVHTNWGPVISGTNF